MAANNAKFPKIDMQGLLGSIFPSRSVKNGNSAGEDRRMNGTRQQGIYAN